MTRKDPVYRAMSCAPMGRVTDVRNPFASYPYVVLMVSLPITMRGWPHRSTASRVVSEAVSVTTAQIESVSTGVAGVELVGPRGTPTSCHGLNLVERVIESIVPVA